MEGKMTGFGPDPSLCHEEQHTAAATSGGQKEWLPFLSLSLSLLIRFNCEGSLCVSLFFPPLGLTAKSGVFRFVNHLISTKHPLP